MFLTIFPNKQTHLALERTQARLQGLYPLAAQALNKASLPKPITTLISLLPVQCLSSH